MLSINPLIIFTIIAGERGSLLVTQLRCSPQLCVERFSTFQWIVLIFFGGIFLLLSPALLSMQTSSSDKVGNAGGDQKMFERGMNI